MKTVIVLGSHRSGSSMLAGILQFLGVDMGVGVQGGLPHNFFGDYQDKDFTVLNEEIIIRAGGDLTLFCLPGKLDLLRVKYFFDDRIKELFSHKKKLWGWKDPFTIITMPLFEPYLSNPYYIIIERDLDSIINSLDKSFSVSKNLVKNIKVFFQNKRYWNFSFLLRKLLLHNEYSNHDRTWMVLKNYYGMIHNHVEGKKHLILSYEDFFENPEKQVRKIMRFLKINPSKKQVSKAVGFVRPELRHF